VLTPKYAVYQVYHLAALSLAKQGQLEDARSYWRRGAEVSPDCPLLPLAEAEFEERAGNLDGASEAYERLVRSGRSGPLG
jgi:tetratricopeptide (TPR) repeat protein